MIDMNQTMYDPCQQPMWMMDLGPSCTALVGCPLLSKLIGNVLATRRPEIRTLFPLSCQSEGKLAGGIPSKSNSVLFSLL